MSAEDVLGSGSGPEGYGEQPVGASVAGTWTPGDEVASAKDAHATAARLAALVRIPTVTPQSTTGHSEEEARVFARLHSALTALYPRVFAHDPEVVGRAGLLLRVPGASADDPVVLMAHQDVVPVPADWQAEGWEHPPFDGVIEDGWVHGRGTLDDKGALTVMLDAVESLLAEGWTPARDLHLLMSADEESYGRCAVEGTAVLEQRGVTPWLVLDEGGAVTVGAFPGLEREAAVIGVSEKGIATVRLTVESGGGHASTPPKESAPGILARALDAIERHPHPSSLNDVSVEMFQTVGPEVEGRLGGVLSRAGLLRPLLTRVLPGVSPEMAAMVRTTTAITQLQGSPGHNVLATSASAILNMRVAVGSTVAQAVAHIRRTVKDDRVRIDVVESSEPSPVSPSGDDARWLALKDAVAAAYPDAITMPYVMLAASDARHVARIAPAVYRFAPLRMSSAQRAAVHGPNEKVEVESLGRGVAFYRALLTGL
ncbi:M20/M25/M40 family metallo-hydrolase [Demequina capsici]|uniref:M20/M25/M40 family metallo-hydrolase n=1 Tax=Demequina capsici TaxID=3075620 RepID=A0AA96JD72_9MICO|nr:MULTISPECIES: M20/M25/M40 family metallo-hydrolase [unclassified Demequina]WNM24844.1 M20/M25/M40 family metallo-hydrolase [Demequina sp. OYTSA14]WNM27751.1 M20/M25/M40 family metallo-hydrolase [Demequina sp. PMTSA13]